MLTKKKMSVLSPAVLQSFRAPIGISPSHISIVGSWEHSIPLSFHYMRLDPEYTCHLRLDNWKQTVDKKIVPFCMDWFIIDNKPIVEIKVIGKEIRKYKEIIEESSEKIHSLLNKKYHQLAIKQLYECHINTYNPVL